MSDGTFYSIIIPSYNRAGEIDELLSSIRHLEKPLPEFECIVVDDGSTDNTEEIVEKHQRDSEYSIRFIQQSNQGPGAARNNGMKHARGDFFIFLDSDTLVDSRWLQAIDHAVQDGVEAFGGPDGASDDFTPLQKAINYSMTSFLTTGGIRGKKKSIGKYYPRSFNMGLSRDVYEAVGGFGGLRHGQDIEFSQRILDSGAKVKLVSDAIVYHKRRTSLKKFFKQVFNWGVARINLYKINSAMIEPVHLLPSLAVVFTLLIVLMALSGIYFAEVLMIVGITILIVFSLHAFLKTKTFLSAALVIIVIPIQVFGYGSGFIWGIFQRFLLGRDEIIGFQKKYYN